jgi:uncharacterized metal-binding protein YceD (DUF177 family)
VEKFSVYNIEFKGLREGDHEYDYKIGKSFFDWYENSLVSNGDLHVVVWVRKRSSFLELQLKLSGTVELTCDRCLELYPQKVEGKLGVFIKFGDTSSEASDDVIWVGTDEHQINVAQLIYETIVVNIPLRHVHPGKAGNPNSCDPEMIKKIREYTVQNQKKTDERWSELKKLLNNN